jgi:hypothetical protein
MIASISKQSKNFYHAQTGAFGDDLGQMSLEHALQRQLAFTIAEFCRAHRVSRSWLYAEWRAGRGPRFKRIGRKKIITDEAAADWRHEDTEAEPQ